jgi:GNAT superfamily N-acetyltransferase
MTTTTTRTANAEAAAKEGKGRPADGVAVERPECVAGGSSSNKGDGSGGCGGGGGGDEGGGAPVAFLCFRFVLEGALEVLYVYELQLEERAQRRGLGRHLMMCAELAARKLGMQAVVLTVLKANASALAFYTQRMKYAPDADSPSQCGNPDAAHEILSKVVDKAAHAAALALVEEGAIVVDE